MFGRNATILILIAGLLIASSCSASTANSDWQLHLEGAVTENMTGAYFNEACAEKCHGAAYRDLQGNTWEGLPLWLLVGRVDDTQSHKSGAFNDSLADRGYSVMLNNQDNSVRLTSQEVKRNNGYLVAYKVNGNELPADQWPLSLVGEKVDAAHRIDGITSIKLEFQH